MYCIYSLSLSFARALSLSLSRARSLSLSLSLSPLPAFFPPPLSWSSTRTSFNWLFLIKPLLPFHGFRRYSAVVVEECVKGSLKNQGNTPDPHFVQPLVCPQCLQYLVTEENLHEKEEREDYWRENKTLINIANHISSWANHISSINRCLSACLRVRLVWVWVYASGCIRVYTCVIVCVCVYIYVCVYIHLSLPLSLSLYMYLSISIYMHIYIYIYIYVYTGCHVHTRICTRGWLLAWKTSQIE